jgi:hypothetical protein
MLYPIVKKLLTGQMNRTLENRLNHMRLVVEQQIAPRETYGRVVLYDPATGEPLPGYVPSSKFVNIYLPDNGRDDYAARQRT